ncbi:MAG: hypothetical protein COB81_11485 [Flavobacteriaceae bacterium]|nr:MAG: hypothetical protein COB81_11485 [Flavobacteriaceae bacterium]
MKKICYLITLLVITSCGSAKYSYSLDESLGYKQGKWLLNTVFEKEKHPHINEYAESYFMNKIEGTVSTLLEIQNNSAGLMKAIVPFEPSKKQLKEIKKATDYHYLINIKTIVISKDLNGFIGNTKYGVSYKKNAVRIEIDIYDLNKMQLVSSNSATAIEEYKLNEEPNWSLARGIIRLKTGALKRLIKRL